MRTRNIMCGVLAGALLLGGCGDSNEAGGALDEQEQAALVTALAQAGMLGFEGTAAFGALVGQATDIGTMGDFSALASQAMITINFDGEPSESYVFSGLFGWTDLNAGTGTVGEAIGVQIFQDIDAFPSSIDETVEGDVLAHYFLGESNSQYLASTGEFTMNASGFGGFEDCPNLPEENDVFEIVTCRYAFGTMDGSFAFEADRITGTGPETFSQPTQSFDLPALRLELEINFNELAAARGAGWSGR
ncbi:MAG TPA: hypothetical protein VFT04_06470 [Gemmatimonadales bacterium]|nr:hypothetical protein [Gemmatimonadales bacterium]